MINWEILKIRKKVLKNLKLNFSTNFILIFVTNFLNISLKNFENFLQIFGNFFFYKNRMFRKIFEKFTD